MFKKFFSKFSFKPIENQEELETYINKYFQVLVEVTYPIKKYKNGFYNECKLKEETINQLKILLMDFIFREGFVTNSNDLYKFLIHYNIFDPNSLANIYTIISDTQDNFLYYRLQSLDTELRYLYSTDIQHLKELLYSIYIRESVNLRITETVVELINSSVESDMSKFYSLSFKLQRSSIKTYVDYIVNFFKTIILDEYMYLLLLMSTILNKNQILLQLNPKMLSKFQQNIDQNLSFPFAKPNDSNDNNNSGPILQ